MKRILGLDLGTNSIGWALVNEAENNNEDANIVKLGVRVIQYDTFSKIDKKGNVSESKNPIDDFAGGKSLSPNAARTKKRGARRNLQRYKLRRKNLIDLLIKKGLINEKTPLTEDGKNTTYLTLSLRAKAAKEKIELEDFARVLLAINKKRGYKSSRKVQSDDDGVAIDGMDVAKYLYDNNLTPGQYALEQLNKKKKYIPDFYRSDLKNEFDAIWKFQKQFYPEILDKTLYEALENQGLQNSRKRFLAIKNVFTAENKGNRDEKKLQAYQWRVNALTKQLPIEEVAFVLVEINNDLNKSSGYLGAISDRSKELFFNKITVGEYLYSQILKNNHTSLKNQVFYRQDYLDEFEQIWETQAKFHPVLTTEFKEEIRDIVIFYQRKLKSQKGLISFCQFEQKEIDLKDKNGNFVINKVTGLPKKRIIGQKVIPKSSPLFQEFKIWQNINNLQFKRLDGKSKDLFNQEIEDNYILDDESRQLLFNELNLRGNLKEAAVLKTLKLNSKEWKTNFPDGLEGNRTNAALFNIYQKIAENEGYGFDWDKKSASQIIEELKAVFPQIGISPEILDFDAKLEGKVFEQQKSFQLWHLLYSIEEDNKVSDEDRLIYGNSAVTLKKLLLSKFGFKPEHAKMLVGVPLQDDYGNLSAKAIKKIIHFLQDGNRYDLACEYAGYNHSNSFTSEENEKRILIDKLEILPKNSLRNPVVEKILNQMVNLTNQIIDEYGKPDEIRVELARELKKSAKEREEAVKGINEGTARNEEVRKIILKDFGFSPTRNDIIRYKLWQELEKNGFKTLFTNQYISRDKIFSKEIDIEHIIPKALLFDDSFSNKTLAFRNVNLKKGERTAFDFISEDFNSELENYIARVESLFKQGAISKGKYKKLLMPKDKLPDGFIERDLRNSQYIAKKAKAMLQELVRNQIVSTSGNITDQLRSDWDIVNVMKELNLSKYRLLGLTETETRWDVGQEKEKQVEVIKDWSKRNDHRHHAMDALTVAFTTHNHIQYINNLNARKDEKHKKHSNIIGIEKIITTKDKNGKRIFAAPMSNFRSEAKKHIESILVSFKAKNKVVTSNINKTKKQKGFNEQKPLTPRGQLHKETVYGKIKLPLKKATKLSKNFTLEQANLIINNKQRELIKNHLLKYDNDSNKAFDSKVLKKEPILWKDELLKEVLCFEEIYTIRKDITPDNFKDVKNIEKIIDEKTKVILKERLKKYNNDHKKAFSDLETNPIWLNEEAGISIKRVTITGVSNVEALHNAKDHFGNEIIDENGKPIPADFVSTGNNHHVAIYEDEEGNLHEKVVSFYEAVARVNENLPSIDKEYNKDKGWTFKFSMKQNEMFVFPNEEKNFNPSEIDLLDEENYHEISPNMFRVQKISRKNYMFNNHLETQSISGETLKKEKTLSGIKYHFIQSENHLKNIIKVRLNHLGKIVKVGEY